MVDQNNRPRPAMGDIRPRRSMDMGRPSGAQTGALPQRPAPQRPASQPPVEQTAVAPTPIQRPQPLPPRPVPMQRPLPRPAQHAQPSQQYAPAQQQQQAQAPIQGQKVANQAKTPKVRKAHPFWRGFLQVIVSLLVIVGVAAAIVVLYLKYYS